MRECESEICVCVGGGGFEKKLVGVVCVTNGLFWGGVSEGVLRGVLCG